MFDKNGSRGKRPCGDHAKVVQCFALEQFKNMVPDNVRYWVPDRPDVSTVARAAKLAEEFVTSRAREIHDSHKSDSSLRFGRQKLVPVKYKLEHVVGDSPKSSIAV